GKLAREQVVAGPSDGIRIHTEGGKLERRRRKVPAARGQGHVDTGLAEADDVGHVVAVDVRDLARIGVVAVPEAGIGSEGREFECRRREVPPSGGERHIDTVSSEPDDVGTAAPGYVGKLARIKVVA